MRKCCPFPRREMTERIVIERVTQTRDNQGGASDQWEVVGLNLAARIKPLSGAEARVAERVSPRATYSCFIWYRADAQGAPYYTPADRLTWRGRIFNIIHCVDFETESQYMYMLLVEGSLS